MIDMANLPWPALAGAAAAGAVWWSHPHRAPMQRVLNRAAGLFAALGGGLGGWLLEAGWAWRFGLAWLAGVLLLDLSNVWLPRPGALRPARILGAAAAVAAAAWLIEGR